MAMTSGAAAASADLDSLYRDLHAAHLHPLWRIEPNLLTEHPMPRAIPWVWRAADMYPLGQRAIRAVPVNRGGERRVAARNMLVPVQEIVAYASRVMEIGVR